MADLYFLLRVGLNKHFVANDWWFNRCREVQANPDGYLDLWAREHGKSTIITIALTIQNILNDPEVTIGIFSHTKAMAKSFLRLIKTEFETNNVLKDSFHHILYENPESESLKWSEDTGIIVKRKNNQPEATIEAHGLVDGMPTGKHFQIRIYDDIVTPDSVNTPEQMKKVLEALDMSNNLGRIGGIRRMIGTRYKQGDAYEEYIKRGVVKPRIYPATYNGRIDGDPVYFSEEEWDKRVNDASAAMIASQMLQNPLAADSVIFQPEWFRYWPAWVVEGIDDLDEPIFKRDEDGKLMPVELPTFEAVFMSVDGAFSKKTTADDTCILTFGIFKAFEGSNKYSAMVLDCFMGRIPYPEQRDMVLTKYGNKYGKTLRAVDGVIIEDKASGQALIPDLRKSDVAVHAYNPGTLDKVARANLVSHLVRDGYLWIPESPKRPGHTISWLSKWHDQMLYFPNVKHDDGVDATTQALAHFDKMGYLRGKAAPPREASYWHKQPKGRYG